MTYTQQTWTNGAAGGTPLSATRLTVMEVGIKDADTRHTALEAALFGAAGRTQKPLCIVEKSGDQTVATSTDTQLTTWTTIKDTDTAFASNTFTAPVAGYYRCALSLIFASSGTGQRWIEIFKNGSIAILSTQVPITGDSSFMQAADIIPLAVSDTIRAYTYHTAGANLDVMATRYGAQTRLSVEWVRPT